MIRAYFPQLLEDYQSYIDYSAKYTKSQIDLYNSKITVNNRFEEVAKEFENSFETFLDRLIVESKKSGEML